MALGIMDLHTNDGGLWKPIIFFPLMMNTL